MSFEDRPGRVRPVTVLAGPNGCGKTSVLFAIVQTLRYAMGYRTWDVPEPSELDVHQSAYTQQWSSDRPSAAVRLELEFDRCELAAIPQVLRDTADPDRPESSRLKPLSDGRVSVEWGYPPERRDDGTLKPANHLRGCDPPGARDWLLGRSRAIHGWRNHRLQDPSHIECIGGLCLFPQDRNLAARVVGEAASGLESPSVPRTNGAPDDGDAQRGAKPPPVWGILEYLSSYVRNRARPLPDDKNWEKWVQDHFDRICFPKKYVGYQFREADPRGAPCFEDGAYRYPLNMAASGEQVIIEYLTGLTYPSPLNYSIILIDEPEIHLHPAWIRQLYRALPDLGKGNQFILTTHSAELRTMAAQDNALCDMGELGGVS